jgi:hypothetical protein
MKYRLAEHTLLCIANDSIKHLLFLEDNVLKYVAGATCIGIDGIITEYKTWTLVCLSSNLQSRLKG